MTMDNGNDYELRLCRLYSICNNTMRKKLLQWNPRLKEIIIKYNLE